MWRCTQCQRECDDMTSPVRCPVCQALRSEPHRSLNRIAITVDMPITGSPLTSVEARKTIRRQGSPRQTQRAPDMSRPFTPQQAKPRQLTQPQDGPDATSDYELLEVLGQGGMGEVVAARQMALDRVVAIKRLVAVGASRRDQECLRLEALITGSLDHPNIVPIYDLGVDQQGREFFAMKKVRGKPWSICFLYLSEYENLEILIRVCDAVAFAHAHGVVHRDLKPENVMIGEFGEVMVMDWGLAIRSDDLVHEGEYARYASGSPAYMAPEMAVADYQRIGPRSDIYLLGACLFEVITGTAPHPGEFAGDCVCNAAKNLIHHSTKSGELLDIALRAMATDPADRFQQVGDFQAALRAVHLHTDSNRLCDSAVAAVAAAKQDGRHDLFARAIACYEQALVLWAENLRAQTGLQETQLAFAEHALSTGDLDLATSLVKPPGQTWPAQLDDLQHQVSAAFRVRGATRRRIRWLTGSVVVAVILTIVVSITAALVTRAEQVRMIAAIHERDTAELHLAALEHRAWTSVIAEDFSGDRMPAAVHSLKGVWSLNKDRMIAVGPDIALAELAALGSGSLRLSFDLVNDHGVAVHLGVAPTDLPDHLERSRITIVFKYNTCEVRCGGHANPPTVLPPLPAALARHVMVELHGDLLRVLVDGHRQFDGSDDIHAKDARSSRLAISAEAGASVDNLRVDRLDLETSKGQAP